MLFVRPLAGALVRPVFSSDLNFGIRRSESIGWHEDRLGGGWHKVKCVVLPPDFYNLRYHFEIENLKSVG